MLRRFCLVLLVSVVPCVSVFAESKPNVIFILLDDMGWGDFGVLYQNESKHDRKHKTPMLDRMAGEGMQLRSHYCPAPVCAPSRSSLLTGVHQGHAEVRDNQFDKALADNHTLATVMKEAGYQTWIVGKYGLQGGNKERDANWGPEQWTAYPTKRGFDQFYGYVRHRDGHQHYPADSWELGDSDSHRTPKQLWHNDKEVSGDLSKCYTTDLFTARSKDWIAKHVKSGAEEPFFLYLAYDTPHAALQLPTMPYPDGMGLKGGLQWIGKPGEMINTAGGTIDSYRHHEYQQQNWTDVEQRFATMVRRIDNCVGDLLQTLRDLSIDDETLVVISCDNGPHHESYLRDGQDKRVQYTPQSFQSYGPFDGTKRDVWEGGIRVGTLAWWPGEIQAGSIDQTPSQFHDWMPTFADAGGIAPPARTDGVSLLPTLTGQGEQRESQVYVEYVNGQKTPDYQDFEKRKRGQRRKQMQVVFVDGFKGVRVNIESHEQPFEIYDLKNDPSELNDLAGSSKRFVSLQQRMKDRVLQIRRTNGSAPRPYDGIPIPSAAVNQTDRWKADVFAGKFSYVPDADALSPASTSDAANTAVEDSGGAVRFSGGFTAAKTGRYRATLKTGTPAFVRIHDAALIDADFGFDAGKEYSTEILLEAGTHPVKVTAIGNGGPLEVELGWEWVGAK